MILPVLQFPDPLLHQKAEPVREITPEIVKLAKDMAETMYAEKGIGLAAPQVGQLLRMIVVDVMHPDGEAELYTFINPELTLMGERMICEEGCLSVPEFRADVERAEKVLLRAQDLGGMPVEMEVDDLMAICLQHEVDHLDGKLFIDRISRLKRSLFVSSLKKRLKREAREQE